MRYVNAGYVVVLGVLFLYAVQLAWRRRRLARAVVAVTASTSAATATAPAAPAAASPATSIGRNP